MYTLTPLRRGILAAGFLLSLGVIALAVLSLVDSMGHTNRRESWDVPVDGKSLTIHSGSGGIDLFHSNDGKVHVQTDLEYGVIQPQLSHDTAPDGSIRLEARCNTWIPFQHCEVHYTVQVPDGLTIDVRSGAGDVSATGLTGTMTLHSAAGDVNATDLNGKINLSSSAGDVNATRVGKGELTMHSSAGEVFGNNLTNPRTKATSTAGDVNLTFTEAPTDVNARSTAGDVILALPNGDKRGYEIASDGSRSDDDHIDPSLQTGNDARTIHVSSSAGDVTVVSTSAG
jgi:hypothetical protein